MCTAVCYETRDFYFGRNLDLDDFYRETVTVTPRNFPFRFRMARDMVSHYAMIGTASVVKGFPLYYEAVNEKGLAMAGLNFPNNAHYNKSRIGGMDNIATFELIPWLLGQCAFLSQVRSLLNRLNLMDAAFDPELPASPLHWMISCREGSLVLEPLKEGLKVYDNPVGVLTNNPPFEYHMTNLNNFMGLSAQAPVNRLSPQLDLKPYGLGMGALGLPGDLSSASRFVKAAFTKLHSTSGAAESESVSQVFHILGSVAQQRGCVDLGSGKYEMTLYSCCCNTDRGLFYYTTYENSQITEVSLYRENLEGQKLISYPMLWGQRFYRQNP